MNNNSCLYLNHSRFKQHLSPFGNNVLDTLVRQWRLGLNNNNTRLRRHQANNNSQQNIHFSGNYSGCRSSSQTAPTVSLPPDDTVTHPQKDNEMHRYGETTSNYCSNNNTAIGINQSFVHDDDLPIVIIPSSAQLIKQNVFTDVNDNKVHTVNDLITLAEIDDDKDPKHIEEINFSSSEDLLKVSKELNHKEITNKDIEKSVPKSDAIVTERNINWCDMFDTELFADIENSCISLKENTNDNFFHMQFEKDKSEFKKSHINTKKPDLNSSTNNIRTIRKKSVHQKKPMDGVSKKIKKGSNVQETIKPSTRKIKYTKAVKSWLNDVDPRNTVEEEIIVENNKESNNAAYQADMNNLKKCAVINDLVNEPQGEMITTLNNKASKKVVQATLAQKDGKMKFKLPSEKQITVESDAVDDKGKVIKERKIKSKFVAPIKSQIPVKSITYDICLINRIEQINDKCSEDNQICIVLVYKSGFCQLNNHHTEETSIPEGVMIQLNEKFYYLKDNTELGNSIPELMRGQQIICYNAKNLFVYFISKYGDKMNECYFDLFDIKIGGNLIDPDSPPENFSDLQKLLNFNPEYTIATDCVLQKTAWYMTLLKECSGILRTLLIENSLWTIFTQIEMKLLPVIAGMEYRGVTVDLEKLKAMENIILTKMKTVEQECYKAAGKTFQINSSLQVSTILYDELKLDTKSNVKIKETIGKGAKSTSEIMLRGLVSVHPLPKLILEYRHLHKAHATFLIGIAQHVKDGLVKPTWVQTAAATGRIACNNPNLQAIPKVPFSLVIFPENGDTSEQQLLNFRSVYTSRSNHTLLAADFKHIECRVFAHAAADTGLLDALRSGEDLFKVLAAKWLNKPESEVSSEDRDRTKRIVYASLYGAGARKLMEILNASYEQTLAITSSFNRTFPTLKSFGRSVVSRCEQNAGRLNTLCGRGRRFKHINSPDFALKSQAERQAVNFVVQGSAADICKMAMVLVEKEFRSSVPPVPGFLVLQIHDELVWELPDLHLERAAVIIKEVMENCGYHCGMSMTLPVEMTVGRNWGEMSAYCPKQST